MKILSKGIPSEEQIWLGKCRNCDSIAQAQQKELNITFADKYGEESFAWELCPVCHTGPNGGMLFHKRKLYS